MMIEKKHFMQVMHLLTSHTTLIQEVCDSWPKNGDGTLQQIDETDISKDLMQELSCLFMKNPLRRISPYEGRTVASIRDSGVSKSLLDQMPDQPVRKLPSVYCEEIE